MAPTLQPSEGAGVEHWTEPAATDAVGKGIDGAVESVRDGIVRGWAAGGPGSAPLTVQLWIGGEPMQEAFAVDPRPDVAAVRGGDGRHGFAFHLTSLGLADSDLPRHPLIEVREAATGLALPGMADADWQPGFRYDRQRLGLFDLMPWPRPPMVLFGPEDVARMRALRGEAPFSGILARIRARLAEPMAEGSGVIERRTPRFRGLVWRNALQDSALLAVVAQEAQAFALVRTLGAALERRITANPRYLGDEVNIALAIAGLAFAVALLRAADVPTVDRRAAERAMGTLGQRLHAMQADAYWARETRDRLAWNHGAFGFAGAGLAALMGGRGESWRLAAVGAGARRCQAWLRHAIDDSGMAREGLYYAGFTLGVVGPFLRALFRAYPLRHYFHAAPGCGEAKLERLVEWYAHDRLPGMPCLTGWNDTPGEPHASLRGLLHLPVPAVGDAVLGLWHGLVGHDGDGSLGDAAAYPNSILADSYAALAAAAGDGPARPAVRHAAATGQLHIRTGWDREADQVTFRCGPHVRGLHGQADCGSFTLAWRGRPVIVDSGAANDPAPGSPSQWEAHSLPCVDGIGQAPAARGRGASGLMLYRDETQDAVHIAGDLLQAYPPRLVRRLVRHVLFLKHPRSALILFDDLVPVDASARLGTRFQIAGRLGRAEPVAPGRFHLHASDGSSEGLVILFATPPEAHERIGVATREGDHDADCFTMPAGVPLPPVLLLPFSGAPPDAAWHDGHAPRLHLDGKWFEIALIAGAVVGHDGRHTAPLRHPALRSVAAPQQAPEPAGGGRAGRAR
jgi:hypothetical protein